MLTHGAHHLIADQTPCAVHGQCTGDTIAGQLDTDLLYHGDNLEILRKYIPDESVDLVYLDPPFNSSRDYNVIFNDESGRNTDAQLVAFEDTWRWGPAAETVYAYLTNTARHGGRVPSQLSTIMAALRSGIAENQMMAYPFMLSGRIVLEEGLGLIAADRAEPYEPQSR